MHARHACPRNIQKLQISHLLAGTQNICRGSAGTLRFLLPFTAQESAAFAACEVLSQKVAGARDFLELADMGMIQALHGGEKKTQSEIAKAIGRSQSVVGRYLGDRKAHGTETIKSE